jgi:mycoredoxin
MLKLNITKSNHSRRFFKLFVALLASMFIGFFSLTPLSTVHAKTEKAEKIQKNDVVILTAGWCHYCTKTRQFLKKNNVKFTEYDIENSNLGYQLYRSLGGKGVPVIRVGDNVMFGYEPEKLKNLLNDAGYHLP